MRLSLYIYPTPQKIPQQNIYNSAWPKRPHVIISCLAESFDPTRTYIFLILRRLFLDHNFPPNPNEARKLAND